MHFFLEKEVVLYIALHKQVVLWRRQENIQCIFVDMGTLPHVTDYILPGKMKQVTCIFVEGRGRVMT